MDDPWFGWGEMSQAQSKGKSVKEKFGNVAELFSL